MGSSFGMASRTDVSCRALWLVEMRFVKALVAEAGHKVKIQPHTGTMSFRKSGAAVALTTKAEEAASYEEQSSNACGYSCRGVLLPDGSRDTGTSHTIEYICLHIMRTPHTCADSAAAHVLDTSPVALQPLHTSMQQT